MVAAQSAHAEHLGLDLGAQADVPVQVQGVWVRPGDWLCADADGIVVLPAAPQ